MDLNRKMRRKEKEITSKSEMEAVIKACPVCRMGMWDGEYPYVVPLNFGYKDDTVYFHCAKEGKKIDILNQNNKVCLQFDTGFELVKAEKACKWGALFESVMAFGTAEPVSDPEEKRKGLSAIMAQYSDRSFEFGDKKVAITALIKVSLTRMTGKRST